MTHLNDTLANIFCAAATIVLLALPTFDAHAEPLVLDANEFVYNPAGYIAYFRDANSTASITDVVDAEFRAADNIPGFGYTTDTIWYRLEVENPRASSETWILRSKVRFMRPVSVYLHYGGTAKLLLYNDESQPFSARALKLRHLATELVLEPESRATIYISFRAGGTAVFPFHVVRPEEMYRQDSVSLVTLGILFAVLGTLIVVNLLHFVAAREKPHLLYCFQELTIGLYLAHMNGYAFQILWPSLPEFNSIASPMLGGISICAALWFSAVFLRLREYLPRVNKALTCVGILTGAFVVTTPFLDVRLANQSVIFLGVIGGVTLLFCALYLAWRRVPSAYYFSLAWFVRLVPSFGFAAAYMGLIETPQTDPLDALQIAVAIQALIFSGGLAVQYRQVMQEGVRVQEELVASLNVRLAEADQLAELEADRDEALQQVLAQSRSIASVSHDLSQPIQGLKLAMNKLQASADHLGLRKSAQDTLDSLQTTLSNMLDDAVAGLLEIADEVDTDMGKLLTDVAIENRSHATSEGLFVRVHATNAQLKLSRQLLRRCLNNLVNNAIRHTVNGGVLISARRRIRL